MAAKEAERRALNMANTSTVQKKPVVAIPASDSKSSYVHVDTPASATCAQKATDRGTMFMFVCDLDKLGTSVARFRNKLDTTFPDPKTCSHADIVHTDTAKDHIVLAMKFSNARSVQSVAKKLDLVDENGNIEWYNLLIFHGNFNNALAYLIHATLIASVTKAQYDPSLVHANFDYEARIKQITIHVKKHMSETLKTIREYADKKYSLATLLSKIGMFEYMVNARRILYAYKQVKDFEHTEFLEKFKNKIAPVIIMGDWLTAHADDEYSKFYNPETFSYELSRQHYTYEKNLKANKFLKYSTADKVAIFQAFIKKQKIDNCTIIEPPQYGYAIKDVRALLFMIDNIDGAYKTQARLDALSVARKMTFDATQHNLFIKDARTKTPLNCEYAGMICEGELPFDLDDQHLPNGVIYLGLNSDYKKFIQKNGLDPNLIR